eukprot:7391943-Prymnesium_polylepis.2
MRDCVVFTAVAAGLDAARHSTAAPHCPSAARPSQIIPSRHTNHHTTPSWGLRTAHGARSGRSSATIAVRAAVWEARRSLMRLASRACTGRIRSTWVCSATPKCECTPTCRSSLFGSLSQKS